MMLDFYPFLDHFSNLGESLKSYDWRQSLNFPSVNSSLSIFFKLLASGISSFALIMSKSAKRFSKFCRERRHPMRKHTKLTKKLQFDNIYNSDLYSRLTGVYDVLCTGLAQKNNKASESTQDSSFQFLISNDWQPVNSLDSSCLVVTLLDSC